MLGEFLNWGLALLGLVFGIMLSALVDLLAEITKIFGTLVIGLLLLFLILLALLFPALWILIVMLLIALFGFWIAMKLIGAILRFLRSAQKNSTEEKKND